MGFLLLLVQRETKKENIKRKNNKLIKLKNQEKKLFQNPSHFPIIITYDNNTK